MESRDKLYYLLSEYIRDNYTTEIFCDTFTDIYNSDTDYSTLNNQERCLFKELCSLTGRFSSNENDLTMPNVYVSEAEIKENTLLVYNKLVR